MKCCKNCFERESGIGGVLADYVSDHGTCDFCGTKDVDLVETQLLTDIFSQLLDLYVPQATGINLTECICQEWFCFSDLYTGNRIMEDMIRPDSPYYSLIGQPVSLKEDILRVEEDWSKFCEDIKHSNRFFVDKTSPIINEDNIFLNQQITVPAGREFFRARITDKPYPLEEKEMRNPPIECATPGRANPEGISYLYLANDIETIMYESRSSYLDYVSVAKFQVNKELKIVSLNTIQKIDPFTPDINLRNLIYNTKLLKVISNALSNPLRSHESKIEYIPTQYICEFIKSLGFDGVEYSSAMHSNGLNYAFFSGDNFTLVDTNVYEVSKNTIEYKRL